MDIRRDRLAAEFATFEGAGNGVVIGAPGVGKTHLLADHFRAALRANRPAFLLALDKHSVRNDQELQIELRLDHDLIDTLGTEARATAAAPGLLLIDSYDALRSEEAQNYVRTLIRRAQNVLQTRWRIVVSVRTFEATRSETLLELFPRGAATPPAEFQLRGVHCRHFFLPTLSDDETRQAVTTIPGLDRIYERGSPEFQRLLHTPFNLWLAEKLLSGGVAPNTLSDVSSEVQLLSLFWHQRISTGLMSLRRRSVLTDVARAMVEARQLSLRLDDVYKREDDDVWQDVFSSEIVAHVGTTRQRVAFAHNILFDYAVSVLLVEDEPAQAAAFLAAEPARPVFLRPSINYYFTRLWFENRDTFWAVAWFLLTSEQAHLRLFGRLIPMAVVVREARTVDDLGPIVRAVHTGERSAPDAVLRLLQARRALRMGEPEMWLATFEQLIAAPDRRFTWDLTVQTFEAVTDDTPQGVLERAGKIGRTILSFVWARRRREAWADALGASWATRLVVRTYCTDPDASRALLRGILDAVGEEAVSIEYIRHIASNINAVWPCDPPFIAEVYERVLGHEETSTEATPMGTPVLPMTSNRRQDFDMCVYELNQHFADFLADAVVHAITGGIRAIDRFVEREHVQPYINEGYTVDDLTFHFSFGDREAVYVADLSESWRASGYQKEELRIADRIFEYVQRAAQNGDNASIDLALRLFAEQARMAFWWAGLLTVAARHPEAFAQRLFPLAVAEPILAGNATVKQVTDFIGSAYSHWRPEQRTAVEEAVLALGGEEENEDRRTRRRRRLLGLIPEQLFATAAARAVRAAMAQAGEIPANEPLVRFNFSSGSFGETDWLREKGADPEKPENKRLRDVSAPLEAFEKAWQNAAPTEDAAASVLPAIEESNRLLSLDGADESVVAMVRTRIATAARLAARTLKPGEPGFDLARSVLLESARHPVIEVNEPRNEDQEYPAWSSRPETEAAQGLPWIALRQPDDETLAAIDTLVRYPDAIIRYLVVSELFRISDVAQDRFWSLIDDRIANDNAPIVRLAICQSLARIAGRQPERVADAARRLWTILPEDRSKRSEFRDILLDIVVWLRVERGNAWARQALDELADSPMSNPSLLRAAVFQLWHKAIPSRLATHRAAVEDVIGFASEAVHQTCRVLRERDRANDERDRERLKDVYGVIDETVGHVYFCLSRQHSRDGDATPEARREFFALVAPVLDEILEFGVGPGFLLAPSVHHFMELLNEVVQFDARRAVIMAAQAARAGEGSNYSIDSLAIREVVQLVERIFADHRSEVQDADALRALMDLLDVFAATGWPEAIQLVWRLDDLFR